MFVGTDLEPERVDDLLGPAESRYFGSGFRGVAHAIKDVGVGPQGLSGVASVSYPEFWSQRGSIPSSRPHLSTLDVLVLGGVLCEADLAHRWGLTPRQRRRAWLCEVSVRAGTRALEDLGAVELTGRREQVLPGRVRDIRSEYAIHVGPMKCRLAVEHDSMPSERQTSIRVADVAEIVGPLGDLTMVHASRSRRHHFDDIDRDVGTGRVSTEVLVDAGGSESGGPQGIDGYYQPSVTAVDAIVIAAQLAQVMLYSVDGLTRGQASNMWLRRLAQSRRSPYQPSRRPVLASLEVVRAPLSRVGDELYRSLDVTCDVSGWKMRGSVAHALPREHMPHDGALMPAEASRG